MCEVFIQMAFVKVCVHSDKRAVFGDELTRDITRIAGSIKALDTFKKKRVVGDDEAIWRYGVRQSVGNLKRDVEIVKFLRERAEIEPRVIPRFLGVKGRGEVADIVHIAHAVAFRFCCVLCGIHSLCLSLVGFLGFWVFASSRFNLIERALQILVRELIIDLVVELLAILHKQGDFVDFAHCFDDFLAHIARKGDVIE